MRIPLSNLQLAKVASFGAVFVGGNVILMHYLVQKRFHQSPYFVTAAEIVLKNKSLIEYLGEPVKFGNPNLSDNAVNYSTNTEAKFEVPVKGSNLKGMMKFSATRPISEDDEASPALWKVIV